MTAVSFTLAARNAAFHDEFGLFLVDDPSGRIGKLRPGDRGYAVAALKHRQVVFTRNQNAGAAAALQLPAGRYFGTYLIQNSSSRQFLASNPLNEFNKFPKAFFSFTAANPDHFSHARLGAMNVQAWEDLTYGGDKDFNDLVLRMTTDHQPSVATILTPNVGLPFRTKPTVSGSVTDNHSGVKRLEGSLDSGNPIAVAPDSAGCCRSFVSLEDWSISQSGGSATGHGSVTVQDGRAVMREGDSLLVSMARTFEVPPNVSALQFTYENLNFDTSDPGFINDAFEAALVDSQGHTLVHSFATSRDAFFNIAEGQPEALGSEATSSNQSVTLDLSGVTAGTQATLILRLVNNDADVQTSVEIACVAIPGVVVNQPPTVTVALANDTAPEGPAGDPYRHDLLTNDPTVIGTTSDDQGIIQLDVQVDGGAFLDVTSALNPDGTYIVNPGSLSPGLHRVTIRATDTEGASSEAFLDITVNTPPVANAGGIKTAIEGSVVTFDASASSDVDAPIFAYRWTLDDGTVVDGPIATGLYPQDGQFSVHLDVTDTAGSVASDTALVTITNAAPVVAAASNLTGAEGQTVPFAASFTDAGVLDTHTATIDWGDGTTGPGTITETAGTGTIAASHAYVNDGVYTIGIVVTDDAGATGSSQARATIANLPPVVGPVGDVTSHQGDLVTVRTIFTDPGIRDAHTATIDWGDGTTGTGSVTEVDGAGIVEASHAYLREGIYKIGVVVRDDAGAAGSSQGTATIANQSPVVAPIADLAANEGAVVTLETTFTDPGILDTHTASIDWGDGTTSPGTVNEAAGAGTVSGSHVYVNDGLFSIAVLVRDDAGAFGTQHATATVANQSPVVAPIADLAANEGAEVSVQATFTDPGILDTHTASIDWGDGTTAAADVTESGGAGMVAASHIYADNGAYAIRLLVRDDGGAAAEQSCMATVANVVPMVTVVDLIATAQTPFTAEVGRFSDPGFTSTTAGTAERFEATIDWGDGTYPCEREHMNFSKL
jgi:hypothetical protein